MLWCYRPVKVITKHETYWCIKEFYYDIEFKKGKKEECWAKNPIIPMGETKRELIKTLEMMLNDVKRCKTKVEKL